MEALGYVGVDGREFFLQPRILDIGYSFLTSLPFRDIVEPFIQDLSDKVRESVSVSVLDGSDIVFVSRVAASRIMTLSLSVGSRLPAYCTSTGRVLLAAMPVAEQRRHLGSRPLVALTKFTLHRESDILTELEKVAKRGWALNDQELEIGLRAVAAPIRDSTGRTVAAINISTPVGPHESEGTARGVGAATARHDPARQLDPRQALSRSSAQSIRRYDSPNAKTIEQRRAMDEHPMDHPLVDSDEWMRDEDRRAAHAGDVGPSWWSRLVIVIVAIGAVIYVAASHYQPLSLNLEGEYGSQVLSSNGSLARESTSSAAEPG